MSGAGFAAVILAAGQGTRMKSALPKVLHPVCGVPMVAHVVSAARRAGATRIVVVVGHGREAVHGRGQRHIFFTQCSPADAVDSGEWRVHFHVPIYLDKFGPLRSSRPQIEECLAAAARLSSVRHFEVETYAWGVLPKELRQADLATGIAQEMEWFRACTDRLAVFV